MNYIFLGKGFEEIEAITTIDLLRRANIPLTTVSVDPDLVVEGAHGVKVIADKLFGNVKFHDAEMLIVPGGQHKMGEHEGMCDLLIRHNAHDGLIAAICMAPSILGDLGILDGKQATCYPGFESHLGASYLGGLVVESQNIITAKGPGLTADFAFTIIEKLASAEIADSVYDAAQY
ncbi:MAG: DJ-1/PfpI family protein [Paludibacteraceae bacterium]|nr:DJ-1/PfpI family protein [Paludibacteraceae bacterium]